MCRCFLLCVRLCCAITFSVEKTDCFQQFPPSFQRPLRKTCKRNVKKCFSGRKTAWKTRVKPWNIHFHGEKLLKSPRLPQRNAAHDPPKKENFTMNKKQKKNLQRIIAAVVLVLILKLLPQFPTPVERAVLHPVPRGGLGRAAQGTAWHQEPPAL